MKASLSLLCALVAAAQAEDRRNWEYLYDHLLVEAVDGDTETASDAYRELIRSLPDDAPTRSEALYWLGRVEYAAGAIEAAQVTLRDGVRAGTQRRRSLELLGQIALEQTAIIRVPTTWTFEGAGHGFVHPWRYMDKGTISTNGQSLVWTTFIDHQEDRLVVGFDRATPAPQGVELRLRTINQDAQLQVLLSDTKDQLFTHPEFIALGITSEFLTIDLQFAEFVQTNTTATIDPRQIDRLILRDVSGKFEANGPNEIHIDLFRVY